MAHELDMKELAESSTLTIRNAIKRWNELVQAETLGHRLCDQVSCKHLATYGNWLEDPLLCEAHRTENMILLVPGRLTQIEEGLHGKYFLSEPLFSRLFPTDTTGFSGNDSTYNTVATTDAATWKEIFHSGSEDDLDSILRQLLADQDPASVC